MFPSQSQIAPAPGAWKPILTGPPKAGAETALFEIAADLRNLIQPAKPRGCLGHGCVMSAGDAGVAVFFHYMDVVFPGRGYGEVAEHLIHSAVDQMACAPLTPGLFGGFPGVGWAAMHLERQGLEVDLDLSPIDEALAAMLAVERWPGQYDLISGVVGLGVYALEAYPGSEGRRMLARALEHVCQLAERSERGATWFTPRRNLPPHERSRFPGGWYNLGMAHGIPAVIAFLGAAKAVGVHDAEVDGLAREAVKWLWSHRLEGHPGYAFANVAAEGHTPTPARAAWCYGDPGAAIALLQASSAFQQPGWRDGATEILRAVARRTPAECGVVDASLCHGAGGLAHILNRAHQATGDPALGSAAVEWFRTALAMRKPGRGVGGFEYWGPSPGGLRHLPEPGLLEGAAGVGLALLGAVSETTPAWDRVLLTAAPAEYLAQFAPPVAGALDG